MDIVFIIECFLVVAFFVFGFILIVAKLCDIATETKKIRESLDKCLGEVENNSDIFTLEE